MDNSYEQEGISLEEAMTMSLTQSVRAWKIDGLQVECAMGELPKGATVSRTAVVKESDTDYKVRISYTIEGDLNAYSLTIATFTTLKKLQEKYPHLFSVAGNLFAFA